MSRDHDITPRDAATSGAETLPEASPSKTRLQEIVERLETLERQNAALKSLCLAAHQLHESLRHDSVVATIHEIIANLVGSEEFAIYEVARDGSTLQLVASMGIDQARFALRRLNEGLIGTAVGAGSAFPSGDFPHQAALADERELTACIPLILDEIPIGAIAIFRLLPQRTPHLTEFDRDLFEVLARHGAAALFASRASARLDESGACACRADGLGVLDAGA